MTSEIFKTRIRECCARVGGQVRLASIAGVTQQAISKWCLGGSYPTAIVASKIAKAAGVSVEWLLGDDETPPSGPVRVAPVSHQRPCPCGCGAFVLEAFRTGRAA